MKNTKDLEWSDALYEEAKARIEIIRDSGEAAALANENVYKVSDVTQKTCEQAAAKW